ncbi:MAG: GNAT family N-acetyltransferase [Actinobacteria bacterium]|nr:GNAT family N-acetyltransferase [Actinomycetota bacterium]
MRKDTTVDRDALLAFELALDEEVCDEVHQESWGRLFLTASTPLIWDANWVGIEQTGMSIEQVVAIADDALGGEGFGHRTIALLDEADGRRLGEDVEAAADRWPRWEVERTRYMLWRGGKIDPGDARAVRLAEIEGLRKAIIDESMPSGGGGQAAVEQLFEHDRRYGLVAGDLWFVAPAHGEPMSACRLLRKDGIGQVEEVGTLTPARERGYAKAIVTAAIAHAQAAGDRTIFITADAADWPQLLYARLGFETVGDLTVLRRRP